MCSFHTHIARAGFVVCAAMERHAWRQCTKHASRVMCTPLYARLVQPVQVLELRLPDRYPAVCEKCFDAAQATKAPPRRTVVDRRPPAALTVDKNASKTFWWMTATTSSGISWYG